jgi:hypothetical protein
MSTGIIVGSEAAETDREDSWKAIEVLIQRGEMEVVTTPLGEILYIPQIVDD